uniref:Uncharacterized protein n=1 Tax=Rhizophora mucronata TaxID=61149 RepID=A0A2P2L4R0_RHIMU
MQRLLILLLKFDNTITGEGLFSPKG